MPETDLILMSLVVFIPRLFALGLLFFPKGWEEAMRWWSLFGTALTLGVSICAFILYKAEVVDRNSVDEKGRAKMALSYRAIKADAAPAGSQEHLNSQDWVGRVDWI